MLRAEEAWVPWTAISQATLSLIGLRASGTRRGVPLRRPVVSSTTHHDVRPATARVGGLTTRQNVIGTDRRRCWLGVTRRPHESRGGSGAGGDILLYQISC